MRILGVIPARSGSKGVVGKNIKILNNIPLIGYTINAAINSELSRVIVSTDSEDIRKVALEFSAEVPFLRPLEISMDNSSSISVAQHALLKLEEIENKKYDAVMLLQPTTPFRNTSDINEAIKILSSSYADSVISVKNVEGNHPARMKYIENGKLIDPPYCETIENQNRQELQPVYIRNGAIYLTRRNILLEGSFKGKNSLALIMPESRSINIDSEMDFKFAEWYSKNQ